MIYFGILLDPVPGNVLLGNAIVGLLSFVAGPILCLWMKFWISERRKILIILYITTASLVLIMGKHYLLTLALSGFEFLLETKQSNISNPNLATLESF